jgi:tRNA (Thr-GGU) A37 N-methylase
MIEAKAADKANDLREGEVAVELPAGFDASLYYIGRIHTPWKRREDCPKNPRETDAVCTVVVDPRWVAGLQGLETVSHVVVLYWMDRARRDLVLQAPHHCAELRGTFALRSPVRPNPIAVSVARLLGIEGKALGRRPRLSGRHTAPRSETLFRLDRLGPWRRGRLAQRTEALSSARPQNSRGASPTRNMPR